MNAVCLRLHARLQPRCRPRQQSLSLSGWCIIRTRYGTRSSWRQQGRHSAPAPPKCPACMLARHYGLSGNRHRCWRKRDVCCMHPCLYGSVPAHAYARRRQPCYLPDPGAAQLHSMTSSSVHWSARCSVCTSLGSFWSGAQAAHTVV